MPSAASTAVAAATKETVEYFSYQWDRVASKDGAAFAVRTTRDAEGRIVSRLHESFKPYPTISTDPKTGSHGH